MCDFIRRLKSSCGDLKCRLTTTLAVVAFLAVVGFSGVAYAQMLVVACAMVGTFELATIKMSDNCENSECDKKKKILFNSMIIALWASASAITYALFDSKCGMCKITLLITGVAIADIVGYVAGNIIGGPKIFPSISAEKTVSGMACSLIFGSLVLYVGDLIFFRQNANLLTSIITIALAIGGDLLESAFKRSYSKKDTGCFLPGHGGLMDRIDSLLLSSVFWVIMRK